MSPADAAATDVFCRRAHFLARFSCAPARARSAFFSPVSAPRWGLPIRIAAQQHVPKRRGMRTSDALYGCRRRHYVHASGHILGPDCALALLRCALRRCAREALRARIGASGKCAHPKRPREIFREESMHCNDKANFIKSGAPAKWCAYWTVLNAPACASSARRATRKRRPARAPRRIARHFGAAFARAPRRHFLSSAARCLRAEKRVRTAPKIGARATSARLTKNGARAPPDARFGGRAARSNRDF